MHVFTKIHLSAAFDQDGKRDSSRDDYQVEYEGDFATGTDVIGFVKARYPSAISYKLFTAATDSERSKIESALGLIRL
jgi:hypothetical protein